MVVPLAALIVLGGGANARRVGERICAGSNLEGEGLRSMVCRMKIVMAVERFMPMPLKTLSACALSLSSILKLTCAMAGFSPDDVQCTTSAVSLSS